MYTHIPLHGMHYLVSFLDLTDLLSCCWIIYWEYSPTFRILPLIIDKNLEKEKSHQSSCINKQTLGKAADPNTKELKLLYDCEN